MDANANSNRNFGRARLMENIDLLVKMKYLEQVKILSPSLNPASGTKTISSATCTLKNSAGAVAGGVNGTAVTGSTAGATATPGPQSWYLLKPAVLVLPAPSIYGDVYTLAFLIVDTDGETWEPVVQVTIFPGGA
jgi:hypothetical protein